MTHEASNTKIKELYSHIDNGGIEVEISHDEYKNISISFTTSYHGYPDIVSTLRLWGHRGSAFLRDLGKLLIEAADTIGK